MVIVSVRRAGDLGSNPGPGENFSLKLILTCQMVILKAKITYIYIHIYCTIILDMHIIFLKGEGESGRPQCSLFKVFLFISHFCVIFRTYRHDP